MKKEKVIIYGASKTGILMAETIRLLHPEYELIGFVDDNVKTTEYPLPILGTGKDLDNLKNKTNKVVLGFALPISKRLEVAEKLLDKGFVFPSIYEEEVSKQWGIKIGRGVQIHKDATICPGTELGDFCIINGHACIESSKIGKGAMIAPHAFVGVGSEIGDKTIVYPGAKVFPGKKIGEETVVGTNIFVNEDLPDRITYLGKK